MDEDECDVHYDELLEIECCTTTRIELKKKKFREGEDDNSEGEEVDKYNESMTKKVWFEKVQTFIDHIHVIGLGMIWVLGIWLSIDEMMARFMGRSIKTYRMKNKPISEEYIFSQQALGMSLASHQMNALLQEGTSKSATKQKLVRLKV